MKTALSFSAALLLTGCAAHFGADGSRDVSLDAKTLEVFKILLEK